MDGLDEGAKRCYEILQFGGMGHTAGMHTQNREAAISYGAKMPASRVVINSPTTHGAIGFSTDLPPSMTLGCGSWGGNVTSDNVSPIHLMDIKRVAWETKPVGAERTRSKPKSVLPATSSVPATSRAKPNRDQIAAIVDQFLSKKIADSPLPEPPATERPDESPVKTIIHELRPQSLTENGANRTPMDFVSETDVRLAIDKGEKIYITSKTILTPSARDLGNEKDVFASA